MYLGQLHGIQVSQALAKCTYDSLKGTQPSHAPSL